MKRLIVGLSIAGLLLLGAALGASVVVSAQGSTSTVSTVVGYARPIGLVVALATGLLVILLALVRRLWGLLLLVTLVTVVGIGGSLALAAYVSGGLDLGSVLTYYVLPLLAPLGALVYALRASPKKADVDVDA